MSPDPIVEQLRAERVRRGWSEWDIASRVGCDQSAVNHWERGRRNPLPSNLRAWAGALGFDLLLVPKGDRDAAGA